MDKLDIAIIREMSQAGPALPAHVGLRSSYRDIAKKLGTSAGTIRNRIRSMHASGVLVGSSVYFNPSILDFKGGACAIEISQKVPKSDSLDRLRSIDGILFIHNFRGNWIGLFLVYENDRALQRKLELFKNICGSKGVFSRVRFPQCTLSLEGLDWSIMHELSKGSFSSYSEFARVLHTTVRTLKRRMSILKNGKAILSSPRLNYQAIESGLPADMMVTFSPPHTKQAAKEQILEVLRDYLLFVGVGETYEVYNLVLPNLHMISKLENNVNKISGAHVERCELVEEHIDLSAQLKALIPVEYLIKSNRTKTRPIQ